MTSTLPCSCSVQPAPQWLDAELAVLGLPGSYPGQIRTDMTWRGWCLPRFTADTARRIAADVNALERPKLRRGLTRAVLDQPSAAANAATEPTVTAAPDSDGLYRLGSGRWGWVSMELVRQIPLVPFWERLPEDVWQAPDFGQLVHVNDGGDQVTWWNHSHMLSRELLCPWSMDDIGAEYWDSRADTVIISADTGMSTRKQHELRALEYLLLTTPEAHNPSRIDRRRRFRRPLHRGDDDCCGGDS